MLGLENKSILITGGAGFVGSFIVDQLLEERVKEIVIIDNFSRGSERNIAQSLKSGKINLIEGDIRDRDLLEKLFEGIDYCFHLAAFRITQCAVEPRQAFEVMYAGTWNVLEACVQHRVKKLFFASNASIYGQADTFPTPEIHHPYNNYTFYGAAKMANELMCRSCQQMYNLTFNAARYFNIYGPRMDTYGKYTEVMIRWYHLIKDGDSPLLFGDGKQTMDFIYVEDVARASIMMMRSDQNNEVFNIASGTETSLEELCHELLYVMGSSLKPKYLPLPAERQKVEVLRRMADVSKVKRMIGFKPKISLREGLACLVGWLDSMENNIHKNSN